MKSKSLLGRVIRISLVCILCIFIGLVLLVQALPKLLELKLGSVLQQRSAEIEIALIRPSLKGVLIQVSRYEEAGVQIDGLRGELPWGGLFLGGGKLESFWVCESASVALDTWTDSDKVDSEPMSIQSISGEMGAAFLNLSERLPDLPVSALGLKLNTIELSYGTQSVALMGDFSLVSTSAGVLEIAFSVDHELSGFEGRLRNDVVGGEIAVDFIASAANWEKSFSVFAPQFAEALSEQQIVLTVDPLRAESEVFLDLSGYVRWSRVSPEFLRAAILGNLGALEFSRGNLSGSFAPASFGMATDGVSVFRSYLTMPIESIQAGAWQESQGEASVRIDGACIHAAVSLGEDALAIQLKQDSIWDALNGSGLVQIKLLANEMTQDFAYAYMFDILPVGIEMEADLTAEAEIQYAEGKMITCSGIVQWERSQFEWPDQNLIVQGASGQARIQVGEADDLSGTLNLKCDRLTFVEVSLEDMTLAIQMPDLTSIQVGDLSAKLLHGQLMAEPFSYNLSAQSFDEILLKIDHLDLHEFSKLIPQFDGEITGSVSGDLRLVGRSKGVEVKEGLLELDESVPAHLSYSTRGMLSAGLPEGSSAFQQYRMAEAALEDLSLWRFQLELFPSGNVGKSILLNFYGESNQSGVTVPVDFTLNVNTDDTTGLIELLRMMQRGGLQVN